MIEKLTPLQEQKQFEVRDYWINKVYSCEETNESYAEDLVEFVYKLADLKKPKVVFADSPLSANLVVHVLKNLDKDSVGASVWDSVRDSVRASVSASVRASVSASVRDSVRDSVWDSVRDSVWASVSASVRDSVRASVEGSVKASGVEFYHNLDYGESWSQGWQAYYDFFTRQTGLITHELFEKYIELVDKANAYYIIPSRKTCIVTRNPLYIHKTWRNDRWVVHDDEGSLAIKWRDGWGQYVLHGITLDKKIYEKILSRSASFKEVMKTENMEHRMLYLKYMDADKLLKGAKAELIGKGKRKTVHFDYSSADKLGAKISRNELYLVKEIFRQDEYFLRYEDPSTGRVYISCVDPEVGKTKDADMCMAWKLGLSKEMYMELKIES